MSKELTPITAKKRLKQLGLIEERYFLGNCSFELVEIMEQYAQDKVLEALERDISKEQLEELCYQLYMVGSTDSLKGILRGRDQVMIIFNERLKTMKK